MQLVSTPGFCTVIEFPVSTASVVENCPCLKYNKVYFIPQTAFLSSLCEFKSVFANTPMPIMHDFPPAEEARR